MAEQIPYGVAVSLINRLASLAFREFGRIYGVMDELENLKDTLESIKAVLADAEERQDQDRAVKIWISRLKEVLHKADDVLDGFVIQDLKRKVNGHGNVVSQVCNQLAFRHKMARKIEKIRQQFKDVSDDMCKLKLNQGVVIFMQNETAWRETSSFVLQSDIIGREESKKDIINWLKQNNTNQNVSFNAIVGIGGLGKTALAQLVFNDDEVKNHFQKKMWVCVSEDFEVKTVLNKLLKSLSNSAVGDFELDQLQKKVQEELNGKKYMLVLDDVWSESQLKWNALRIYLMCGDTGSKILVTTRSEIVAQTMGINNPYVLKGLTKEQSWALLKNLAFADDAITMKSPNLESIGERIAEKCKGVPLAIRTVGGFLQSQNQEGEWLRVLNGDFWRLCEEKSSIMPVLKLSFQNLPLELRQCFAYCSLYPKDWGIDKDELIQLWMAQGYLDYSVETQSMEDVGNQYVKILLMRSFFQDASMDGYDNIASFKMHDLMHDLAESIVGNDCYLDSDGKGIIGRPTHISFMDRPICSLDSLNASKLRTIICYNTEAEFLTKSSVVTSLKYLRVLDLSYSSITTLPKTIGKSKHLRHLDLSGCEELTNLPKSIGNLVSLQTLKLSGCEELEFSVEVITKLISLRCLEILGCKAFGDGMPAGLGKLTSLQYLTEFVVGDDAKRKCGKLNELKHLNNLRGRLRISKLGLVKDVVSESQDANLKAKKDIDHLELDWRDHGNACINKNSDSLQLLDNLCPHQNLRALTVNKYPGVRFSSWLPTLINIVEINLSSFSDCQHLPPLERLPWLKRLYIRSMNELKYIHYECLESQGFFPSLECLTLVGCQNLRGWQRLADINNANDVSPPPFLRLSHLEIFLCPNLTCMPTFPHLEEKLLLQSCSVKPIIDTCQVQDQSSSFVPLSGLEHLCIGDIDMEAMPEAWMRNLTSLTRLSIEGSPTVVPVLRHLQQLPLQLEELDIIRVDELDLWKENDDVPHGLRSLQKIGIRNCHNQKALPEWICDLQSLRHVAIFHCPKLESLPEGMCYLTNLQTLRIEYCDILGGRCEDETGADWHKIAHIPTRTVRPLFFRR